MREAATALSSRIALLLSVFAVVAAGFAALCLRSPSIDFLSSHSEAEWILFPSAVDIQAHKVASLDTRFTREWTLSAPPRSARLRVRAAKRIELKINELHVDLSAQNNWKDEAGADVAALLRPGTNFIDARVFDDTGPPALWFVLDAGEETLRSDQSWRASSADSAWRNAALASNSRVPGPGNELSGGENTVDSLRLVWRWWIAFAGVGAGILFTGYWSLGRSAASRMHAATPIVSAIAVLWMILFWNNARLSPIAAGFDSQAHIDYIKYLQDHRALPWPNEGVQMFQPPLFYLVAATVLSFSKISAVTASGVLIVRALTTLFGVAHFIAVFFSLRLLWPVHVGRQLIGVMLAAFLPMNLYMSHYCTNETLAALLVSVSVWQTLRILRQDQASWPAVILLGLTSGAAALTKFTAFLALPFIVAVLAAQWFSRRATVREWTKLAALCAIAVITSGWHYLRLAIHAGTIVIGGWDPASGFVWWQEDGYRVARYFLRFGESLVRPYFSASASFGDGIYSTLWGDGLGGGVAALISRVPWNFQFMTAGYLLALLPCTLILVGTGMAVAQWLKRGEPDRFLLTGIAFALFCGLIYINLKVPAYASVKAFYGLSALTPLAVFGALGWEFVTRGRRAIQFIIGTALIVWAMNSYASVWLRDAAPLHIYRALCTIESDASRAASELKTAIEIDPANATARRLLAGLLGQSDHVDKAIEQAARAVGLAPADAAAHLQLASVSVNKHDGERALAEVRRALELGPENVAAHGLLSFCFLQSGSNREAIDAARDGLAVSPFNADLHYTLATALARNGDFATASNHFAYALLLRPAWPDARTNLHLALQASLPDPQQRQQLQETAPDSATLLGELAWLLATSSDESRRDGDAAITFAQRACALTRETDPELLDTLAAAFGETGRFQDAIRVAERARDLARAGGADQAAAIAEELLSSFRRGEAFRENTAP